jgi:hypothetical protein
VPRTVLVTGRGEGSFDASNTDVTFTVVVTARPHPVVRVEEGEERCPEKPGDTVG